MGRVWGRTVSGGKKLTLVKTAPDRRKGAEGEWLDDRRRACGCWGYAGAGGKRDADRAGGMRLLTIARALDGANKRSFTTAGAL